MAHGISHTRSKDWVNFQILSRGNSTSIWGTRSFAIQQRNQSFILRDARFWELKKLNTTAHHPQCDGMIERLNRTFKSILRKHSAKFGAEWDTYLPGVLWAYCNTPHTSTGEKTLLSFIWLWLLFPDWSCFVASYLTWTCRHQWLS